MATVAKWGNHKFKLSTKIVNPIYDFSTSYTVKEESSKSTSDKKKSKKKSTRKKRGPEEPSFSVDYIAAAGASPRKDFTAWRKDIGKINYLYIGNTKYGAHRFELRTVDVSDVILDAKGRTAKATVSLSFYEIIPKKKKGSKGSKSGAKNAKPSKDDAKSKKKKK